MNTENQALPPVEIQHVIWFVTAAANDYCSNVGHKDAATINNVTARAIDKTWKYFQGRQCLDASCSDFECSIAMEAWKALRPGQPFPRN